MRILDQLFQLFQYGSTKDGPLLPDADDLECLFLVTVCREIEAGGVRERQAERDREGGSG